MHSYRLEKKKIKVKTNASEIENTMNVTQNSKIEQIRRPQSNAQPHPSQPDGLCLLMQLGMTYPAQRIKESCQKRLAQL